MINQVLLVGKIKQSAELKKTNGGFPYANMIMEVNRPYKNNEGFYECDDIEVSMWRGIAENAVAFCEKGNIVAVKGRLQSSKYEKDGQTYINYEVIAERVSFVA